MDPNAAPFIGQVAQWGAVGVLVAFLAFTSLTLWRRAVALQDQLNDMLGKQIEGDFKVAASTEAVGRSVDALRVIVEVMRADIARIRP